MNLSQTDARALFKTELIDVYKERLSPTGFFRSFFVNKESSAKNISIEVSRGTEKIAVDVSRNSEGNRNTFSKSTLKMLETPFFREYFDLTQLDAYDNFFGAAEVSDAMFAQLLDEAADKLAMCQDKIERRYELMCAQVLLDGVVTVNTGLDIDFKRKATSMVDLTSTTGYWTVSGHDIFLDLENGGNFLRRTGKSTGGTINGIFGAKAYREMLKNSDFRDRNNLVNIKLDAMNKPQRDSVGGVFNGQLSAGPFTVNVWTVPDVYDAANGDSTPYMPENKVILLPETPRFKMAFAAVPQLITPGSPIKKGAFVTGEYIDERKATHDLDVKSAGCPVPVAVDQIYTMQVTA